MKFDEFAIKMYEKLNNPDECINFSYNNIGLIITSFRRFLEQDKTTELPLIDSYDIDDAKDLYEKLKSKKGKMDKYAVPLYFNVLLHLLTRYHSVELKEEEEVNIPKSNIIYRVLVADNKVKEKLFTIFLPMFALEAHLRDLEGSIRTQQTFVGIDYEFKERKIALMQINFERIPSKIRDTFSFIWIVNPGTFNDQSMDILVKFLMRNKKIFKILHGSDSLDTPYMFEEMFKNDVDTIRDFESRHIDTRFLCEYFKISTNVDNRKCAIYDALLYFKTISKKKYDFLNKTHDEMGPVQYITWEIDKLSNFHLKYALYDVLFLKHFLFDIYIKAKRESPRIYEGYHMIPRIVQLIFLERRGITHIYPKIKEIIDKMNNYFFYDKKNKQRKLIDTFTFIEQRVNVRDYSIKINHLSQITYIRKYVLAITKYMIYSIINGNFDVFEKKDTLFKDEINIDLFYDLLEENKYNHLIAFFKKLEKEISSFIV